jgi:imidazoleglycerol phosphate dehydratase HisB
VEKSKGSYLTIAVYGANILPMDEALAQIVICYCVNHVINFNLYRDKQNSRIQSVLEGSFCCRGRPQTYFQDMGNKE